MQLSSNPGPFVNSSFKSSMELPLQFLKAQHIDSPNSEKKYGNTNGTEPECLIPGGQDLDAKPGTGFAPRATGRCALDLERIAACRQRGVAGNSLLAACLVPIIVKPIQLVTVPVRFRVEKAQG